MGFDELGNLYVVVNRLYNFVAGRLREDEINFRLLRSKTGTLSYVHTGRPSVVEENLLGGFGGGGPIYEIHDNNLGTGFVSSTTPIYLGSVGGRFNSASHYQIATTTIALSGMFAMFVKYLI